MHAGLRMIARLYIGRFSLKTHIISRLVALLCLAYPMFLFTATAKLVAQDVPSDGWFLWSFLFSLAFAVLLPIFAMLLSLLPITFHLFMYLSMAPLLLLEKSVLLFAIVYLVPILLPVGVGFYLAYLNTLRIHLKAREQAAT